MKKIALFITFIMLIFTAYSQDEQVVISFITQNAYGNNLYIDNFTLGKQFNIDVAIVSINNIPPDTSYTIGSGKIYINPKVSIVNVGLNDITTPFTIKMLSDSIRWGSIKTVNSLSRGQIYEITFDTAPIPISRQLDFRVFTELPGDQNRSNDTLYQNTIIFPGVQRKVLLEEWTSATCGPCAANNPTIDAFVHARFDSIVAIKYHVGWPSPGNDPMYLYNPTQSYDRRYYYGVNAVPHVIMGGWMNPTYPYSNPQSLPTAFASCITGGTPITLTVTDTRIPGDTIQADVTLTIMSPLRGGNYKLRVHAVERLIHYASPPGTNGETDFYDVFRRAYPTSDGTAIPTAVGTYNFVFKYKKDTAVWVDSLIYTAAFVQNDITKEIMNAAKARQVSSIKTELSIAEKTNSINKNLCVNTDKYPIDLQQILGKQQIANGVFHFELFESMIPPLGWRLVNPDKGITFASHAGISGPSFGGNKTIKLDFYSYSNAGQTDTLYSRVYKGLTGLDSIKFDWAYAQYTTENDRLIIKVSKDGGVTFPYTIFNKAGSQLATAPPSTQPFIPTSGQWQTFNYSLSGILTSLDEQNDIPQIYKLNQNYPNPFNPVTSITYTIPKPTYVMLKIYDVLGQNVSTLVNTFQEAGEYTVQFKAENITSSLYFYKLTAGDFISVKKMMLIK